MDTTATVIEKRRLTDVTTLFVIHAPLVARNAAPGQFVILRVTETGERVPISLTDFDREAGTITLVVQVVGRTTALVCALEEGDEILDVAGPLGRPVELPESGHAVLIGGVTRFACVDGPFFPADEIDFDEAAERKAMYAEDERIACELAATSVGL